MVRLKGGGSMPEDEFRGQIDVSPTAIASIVNDAILSCYGVVGTVPKDLPTGIATALSTERKRGVEVRVKDGQIAIDVYIIVEYGTRIAVVARSVMNVVKFSVERALGVPVAEVNVHVDGLRVSNVD
jgi:uncharacterized alkaline shock family protein YloU